LQTVVVVPIDDGQPLRHHLLKVDPLNIIASSESLIYQMVRSRGLVGQFFRSGLVILPLAKTLTATELRGENLAEIRTRGYRTADNFPAVTFAEFFSQFYVEGQHEPPVHFLAWLPHRDRGFV
jgi:hypothetical protein